MNLLTDLRQGWREFRSTPSLSAVAVATLGLGVAGATTMFAMLGAITAAMVPPGVDADRVGRVVWTTSEESGARTPLSAEEYGRLRAAATTFETLSASADESMVLGGDGPAVPVKRISADYLRTLGFVVSAGRGFTASDERSGGRVAIVREAFLRRLPSYGLGKTVRLGSDDFTIVGVLPDRCWYPVPGTDVWLPLQVGLDGVPAARTVVATARLRSAEAYDAASAQVRTIGQRLAQDGPSPGLRRLRLVTIQQDAGRRIGFGLVGLLGPSVVVLLIACANVANLLLARAARREREMAVRAALGAGRLRLVRERLAESAWMAGAGGALGVALAVVGVRLLRAAVGSVEESRSAAEAIRLNGGALAFALATTVAIPFVFGLVPAIVASRPNLLGALHQTPARRKPRRGPYGGRDVLVVIEIGLAIVLVVTTAMYTRAFTELERTDLGFDADNVLIVGLAVDHGPDRKASDARVLADIVEAVRQVRGVQAVAAGSPPDFRGETVEFERCAGTLRVARTSGVGPGYFSAIGLRLNRGRGIEEQDRQGSPPVAVVSESQAARCWPGTDPIGRRIRIGAKPGRPWLTVVGVARDTMTTRLIPDGPQAIYLPYAQGDRLPDALLARSDRELSGLVKDVRAAIRRVDATQPLDRVDNAGASFRGHFSGVSIILGILGGFSAFALALGALGVFSVMSYMVAERTREFGIRIALGASRRQVIRLVLGQAFVVVAIGGAVSVTGTLAVTRVAFRQMAELAVTDPMLWLTVAGSMALVAVGASLVPARKAMRVEPMVALRAE